MKNDLGNPVRPTASGRRRAALPATVIGLGVVSLLTDVSSEAIFPLLPTFLATLGASNAFIGLVEGAADLVANVLKYVTGVVADRRTRLKPLVLAGYGLSTVARPLVAFALAPWHVLAVRVVDRVGKGVRTSPRDALIAVASDPSVRAYAHGFHRAMDHAGAALGTLLAVGLLGLLGAGTRAASAGQMRAVFLWAALPGLLAMIALTITRERQRLSLLAGFPEGPPDGALDRRGEREMRAFSGLPDPEGIAFTHRVTQLKASDLQDEDGVVVHFAERAAPRLLRTCHGRHRRRRGGGRFSRFGFSSSASSSSSSRSSSSGRSSSSPSSTSNVSVVVLLIKRAMSGTSLPSDGMRTMGAGTAGRSRCA